MALDVARFVDRSAMTSWVPPSRVALEVVRAAFYHLFLHEAFHHKNESLATRLEVVTGSSRFLPYKDRVYRPAMASGKDPGSLEESLANADSYRRLSEATYRTRLSPPVMKGLKDYLKWRFPFDPPGYRQASDYLTESKFVRGLHVLEEQVITATATTKPAHRWTLGPNLNEGFFGLQSDIWVVVSGSHRVRLPFLPLRIGVVSTEALAKALQRNDGYQVVKGGKGSHLKLKASDKPTLILPGNKKELSPGVVRQVAKTLQIPDIHAYLQA